MKKNRRRKPSKVKLAISTAIHFTPHILAIGGITFALYHYRDEFKIGDYDYSNFLNNDSVIESQEDVIIPEEEYAIEDVENYEDEVEEVKTMDTHPEIIEQEESIRTTTDLDPTVIPNVSFDKLNDENELVNAWIYIPNGGISLPIVQCANNSYYLTHDINNEEDRRGTIFMDYRNNPLDSGMQELSDVTCIYGHNMANGTMFAPLSNYKSQTYYDKHQYGVLVAENGEVYKIDFFAGNIISNDDGDVLYVTDFVDESLFKEYFDEIIMNSTFESDCDIEFGDKIIALTTCSYERGNARFILYGRLSKLLINDQEVQNTLGSR